MGILQVVVEIGLWFYSLALGLLSRVRSVSLILILRTDYEMSSISLSD